MCGRLPFSTEYKLKVSRPQGAGAALCVLWAAGAADTRRPQNYKGWQLSSGAGTAQVVSGHWPGSVNHTD